MFGTKISWYIAYMTYVVDVPIEVDTPVSESDSDVRSITRLPGFIRLEPVSADQSRYQLTFEVEGGSLQDATDAADQMIVDYEDALDAYRPRLLGPLAPRISRA
jgi:hypothetical protein